MAKMLRDTLIAAAIKTVENPTRDLREPWAYITDIVDAILTILAEEEPDPEMISRVHETMAYATHPKDFNDMDGLVYEMVWKSMTAALRDSGETDNEIRRRTKP